MRRGTVKNAELTLREFALLIAAASALGNQPGPHHRNHVLSETQKRFPPSRLSDHMGDNIRKHPTH
ncbi:hypothetical protein C4B68_18255 [Streptomyces dengpaensis]|uniref:Uncharacterized protein n=2 Tax=Streptomyces TaxID=1883 RepID=A0ABN5I339_9ACTN|nr:hypothetical protein C4B68_18255 [Streptomyces dengpaensis]